MTDPAFTTLVCKACGKAFPVPTELADRPAVCPWCHTARAATAPVAEPLPLPPDAPPAPPPKSSRRVRWLLVGVLVCLGAAAVAFAVSHATRWLLGPPPLKEFVAPDGSCRVLVPGTPVPQPPPGGLSSPVVGGERFATPDYPARTGGLLGWYDLDAEAVKLVRAEDVIADVTKARAAELGGQATAEAVVRVDNHAGAEVRYAAGAVVVVERYVAVVGGPRPRVYAASVGGPGFDPDGEAAKRVMRSLRAGVGN